MLIVGGGPGLEDGERARLVAEDERTDGKLGGTEAGEKTKGLEGGGHVVESVLGHEVGEENADESAVDARSEGAENGELFAIGQGKRGGDAGRCPAHSIHQLAGRKAGERMVKECGRVECGREFPEFGREQAVACRVEHVLELVGHKTSAAVFSGPPRMIRR